jgi:hypothetical protein
LPRTEILVIAGVCVLAFAVTLAVVGGAAAARARRASAEALLDRQAARKPSLLSAEDLAITPEDFLLPTIAEADTRLLYAPFRPRLARWNPELIRKYWVPPREIAAEIVESINDQNMQRLFQNVP